MVRSEKSQVGDQSSALGVQRWAFGVCWQRNIDHDHEHEHEHEPDGRFL